MPVIIKKNPKLSTFPSTKRRGRNGGTDYNLNGVSLTMMGPFCGLYLTRAKSGRVFDKVGLMGFS